MAIEHPQVPEAAEHPQEEVAKEAWSKPEIVSYKPAASAQGISYTPLDGLSNLTP